MFPKAFRLNPFGASILSRYSVLVTRVIKQVNTSFENTAMVISSEIDADAHNLYI